MINRINEHIEYHKSIDSHKSDVAFLEELKSYIMILEGKLDINGEDITFAHTWLDSMKVPRANGGNEYSIVGRFELLLSREDNKMDKQEFNEGHIAEALDRVNIILCMVGDLLTDHPGIEKTGQVDRIEQISGSLMDAYQAIGGYGVEI